MSALDGDTLYCMYTSEANFSTIIKQMSFALSFSCQRYLQTRTNCGAHTCTELSLICLCIVRYRDVWKCYIRTPSVYIQFYPQHSLHAGLWYRMRSQAAIRICPYGCVRIFIDKGHCVLINGPERRYKGPSHASCTRADAYCNTEYSVRMYNGYCVD